MAARCPPARRAPPSRCARPPGSLRSPPTPPLGSPTRSWCAYVYLDALVIKIRDRPATRNFSCYGLTRFPEAVEAVYPEAWVQTCIVHQIRSSLRFVTYRDRRPVARDFKRIYTGSTATTPSKSSSASPCSGTQVPDDLRQLNGALGADRAVPGLPRQTSGGSSTRPTRSRRSTARSARSSRPAAASPTRSPCGSCSTSRSPRRSASGATRATGARRWRPSASTSATGCPPPQSDIYTIHANGVIGATSDALLPCTCRGVETSAGAKAHHRRRQLPKYA